MRTHENDLFNTLGHEDFTLIVTIDRHVGLDLSHKRGYCDDSFMW